MPLLLPSLHCPHCAFTMPHHRDLQFHTLFHCLPCFHKCPLCQKRFKHHSSFDFHLSHMHKFNPTVVHHFWSQWRVTLFKLAIIYVSLAPLPINPMLPTNYKDSKAFFHYLFCSSPYSTHKFHKFDPHWKCNYATWTHSLEHKCFCREVYCRYHM